MKRPERHPLGLGFTLVELLVVVAIIALLLALLLPSLQRAEYRGRVGACSSNLKQIVAGLTVYAGDNNGWYPKRGAVRSSLTGYENCKDIMKPYYGGTMAVFDCPVVPTPQPSSSSGSDYALFFGTKGAASGAAIGGLGPRVIQYDVNGSVLSDGTTNYWSASTTWNYVPLGGIMDKVGDAWRKNSNPYPYYTLLAADSTIHYGGCCGPGSYRRWTNHHDFDPMFVYDQSYRSWLSTQNVSFFPAMSGNFAGTDGSVKAYRIPATWGGNGQFGWPPGQFDGIGNQIIPTDFAVK